MTESSQQHTEVVRRAINGDNQALSDLVALYHDRVYRYGKAVCRDVDIDDAVQEAFLALTRSRHKLDANKGVASWLYVTVRNACRQMLRPLGRRRQLLGHQVSDDELAERAGDDISPEDQAVRAEMVSQVRTALAALDPQYREILLLRDLEGVGGDETAKQLGLSLPAMKSRLRRARVALRESLA